jgi:hypothetical protein
MDETMSAGSMSLRVPPRTLPAAIALRGPGRLGREGAEGVLIFNAGQGLFTTDLVAQFYTQEFGTLDWLDDYLRNEAMTHLVRDLQNPPEEEEEEEEFLMKNMVLSVEPDEV